jgi:hypothetical protein
MINTDLSEHFNVYCDESCHLENDGQQVMALGAVWCPSEKAHEISTRLREIKNRNSLKPNFEPKWVKVSPAKLDFYLSVINYFFENENLHFRGVVIPDKTKLDHPAFSQDHDLFYYKMWFVLLKQILDPNFHYRIYIDIKDTHGQAKVLKLHEILCNANYDFDRDVIERVQQIRSHEVEIMQLTDLWVGALSYLHRNLATSTAKAALIERVKRLSGLTLIHSTLPWSKKVNLLIWSPKEL